MRGVFKNTGVFVGRMRVCLTFDLDGWAPRERVRTRGASAETGRNTARATMNVRSAHAAPVEAGLGVDGDGSALTSWGWRARSSATSEPADFEGNGGRVAGGFGPWLKWMALTQWTRRVPRLRGSCY